VAATGYFGEKTEKALRRFQENTFTDSKEWDAILGAKTWERLF
jgi:peptidoglycan hydrolase-like protein with peptidoglycan-binding domain